MSRHTFTCALSACLFAAAVAFGQNDVTPSKDVLTAGNMAELHRLIRLQEGEYRWDAIPWYASIWHARRAAEEEDKPIFVFGTGARESR